VTARSASGPRASVKGRVLCRYCGRACTRSDTSSHLYARDYGPVLECRPCRAWVGLHRDGRPLGTPANHEDRELRKEAHKHFDVLWRAVMRRDGVSQKEARSAGYRWLSETTGITYDDCHMGMLHGDDLRKVIEVCRPYSEPLFRGRS
jgi:hypothetical protein